MDCKRARTARVTWDCTYHVSRRITCMDLLLVRSVRDDAFACIESWTIADRAGLMRPLRAAEISYRCGVTGPCVEL